MSYYRRLIEESEKKRILGMHNTYKSNPRTWVIREAYSGTAGEKFDSVEACKKQLPYNVATTLGINWNEAKKGWGSDGSQQQNLVLRNAMCDGWRIGDAKEGGSGTPTEQKPGEQQGTTPGGSQGTTPITGNQPVDDKQYSEEYITPTFGQTPKAD
jgi:hypothetical protein